MKIKSSALVFAVVFAVLLALSAAAQPTSHFDGQSWWNHIKVLADDKLEGRDTGSRGEREAQKYAVEQLKRAGAEPAGRTASTNPSNSSPARSSKKIAAWRSSATEQTRTAHARGRCHHQHSHHARARS